MLTWSGVYSVEVAGTSGAAEMLVNRPPATTALPNMCSAPTATFGVQRRSVEFAK